MVSLQTLKNHLKTVSIHWSCMSWLVSPYWAFKRMEQTSEKSFQNTVSPIPVILAWRIPWTEEPGRLQPTGLHSQTRLKWLSTHVIVYIYLWVGSTFGSMVKHLPAKQEIRFQSLDCEDPLEKKMATHSTILAWEIPWTEKPSGLQSMGS